MPKTISTKELRTQFPRIRKEMAQGERFILIHRSRPIAELTPLKNPAASNTLIQFFAHPPKQFLFRAKKSAVDLIREERN